MDDQPDRPRVRDWLPVVAAVLLVLAVAGFGLARGGRSAVAADGGFCPGQYLSDSSADGWVPAPPPAGLAPGRLAPTTAPDSVTVCEYDGGADSVNGRHAVAFTGAARLGGDLAAVTHTLAFEPTRLAAVGSYCPQYLASTDGDNFLLALTYPAGTVWVAAPGSHCLGASNGRFTTPANLRSTAAASSARGRWIADAPPDTVEPVTGRGACRTSSAGRLGQDSAMVPSGATSAVLCADARRHGVDVEVPHPVPSSGLARLVTALNGLPTRPDDPSCRGTATRVTPYRLLFHYRSGPDVQVRVDAGCEPAITNGTLRATEDGSVVTMVEALVR